jgi:oligosaccharide translocation protein RFT1
LIVNYLKMATRGLSYLLSYNLLSKLLTFSVNTFTIRSLHEEIKGQIFSLELLVNSVIFLSTEAYRRACLRTTRYNELVKAKNIAWLTIPTGVFFATIFYFIFYYKSQTNLEYDLEKTVASRSLFQRALIIYVFSALLEILAQPLYIVAQNLMLFGLRVSIEGFAVTLKIGISFLLVSSSYREQWAVIAFSYAQFLYGLAIFFGYTGYFIIKGRSEYDITLLLERVNESNSLLGLFDVRLISLTSTFLKQSIFKYFLTEGEKFILFYYGTMTNQGVYDLVVNLGSVVARTIFQSVEEIGFTEWSKELGSSTEKGRDGIISTTSLKASGKMLELLLKFCVTLGSIFLFFGPAYTHTLLLILYGNKWTSTEAPSVLAIFCIYILFMAVNGVTEAFVHAASDRSQLDRYNYWMPLFSGGYLLTAYLCLSVFKLSIGSLIAANCLNMALRITYSVNFINNFFKQFNRENQNDKVDLWKNSIPSLPVFIVFGITFVITNITGIYLNNGTWFRRILHIGIGTSCLCVLSIALYMTEKQFLTDLWKLLRGRKLEHRSKKID